MNELDDTPSTATTTEATQPNIGRVIVGNARTLLAAMAVQTNTAQDLVNAIDYSGAEERIMHYYIDEAETLDGKFFAALDRLPPGLHGHGTFDGPYVTRYNPGSVRRLDKWDQARMALGLKVKRNRKRNKAARKARKRK